MNPPDRLQFVHSDVTRALVSAKRNGAVIKPGAIQDSLISFLSVRNGRDGAGLAFPAFNYDYGRLRIFNVEEDLVQVGAFPEWVRRNKGFHRTRIPFFSVLTASPINLPTNGTINPFGAQSAFQWLTDNDATLTLFGASFHSLTFIHYVEEMAGGPLYRYLKKFPGKIVDHDSEQNCDFAMYVRPMGVHMDYDWPRLESELKRENILQTCEHSPHFQWLSARTLLEYWGNQIADDPFFLLDRRSRDYFIKATEHGTRRVQIREFEDV